LYTGIRQNRFGIYNKYNELFTEKKLYYDVLFLGSSRTEMHFHPKFFDQITGLKSYNMGIEGATVRLSWALLKTYCYNHKKPKFLIFNVDYFFLDNDSNRIVNFPRYFPYLDNYYLKQELSKIDKRINSFYYNPFHSLPYTQINYLSASLHGWLGILGKYDTLMYKGFQTNFTNEIVLDKQRKPFYAHISATNREYLDSIISFSNKQSIKLVLVTTPVSVSVKRQVLNKKTLSIEMKHFIKSKKIDYFDYTDSLKFDNPVFFADVNHLNLIGAKYFTESFSKVFNTILD